MTDVRTLRLDDDLADRLRLAALITGKSANTVVLDAVAAALTELEKSAAYKRRRAELIIATTPVEAKPTARRTKPVPTTEPENQ